MAIYIGSHLQKHLNYEIKKNSKLGNMSLKLYYHNMGWISEFIIGPKRNIILKIIMLNNNNISSIINSVGKLSVAIIFFLNQINHKLIFEKHWESI